MLLGIDSEADGFLVVPSFIDELHQISRFRIRVLAIQFREDYLPHVLDSEHSIRNAFLREQSLLFCACVFDDQCLFVVTLKEWD